MKKLCETQIGVIDAMRLVRAGYPMERAIAMSDEIDKWVYEEAAIRALCYEPARLFSVAPYLARDQFEALDVPPELREQYFSHQYDSEVKLEELRRTVLLKGYEAIIFEEHYRDTLRGYRGVAVAKHTGEQIALIRCASEMAIPSMVMSLGNLAITHYKEVMS